MNSLGTTSGNDLTFTTHDGTPISITQTATGITLTGATLNRLSPGHDDPASLWIWVKDGTGYSTFYHVNVSDGSAIASFGQQSWGAGRQITDSVYLNPTLDERFGHSNSCSLIVIRQALAPVIPVPVPTIPDVRLIRRLRQSPHLSDEQFWYYVSSFQLDLEVGLGTSTGQGMNPQIMLQWSDDGGHTWGPEQWVSAGVQGQYEWRAIWRRLGRSRDRVWRVAMTDPVAWRLLTAYVDVQKGVS